MKELIEQEIKWCEEHRGMASKEFGDGFIAGLKQALFLIKAAEQSVQRIGARLRLKSVL